MAAGLPGQVKDVPCVATYQAAACGVHEEVVGAEEINADDGEGDCWVHESPPENAVGKAQL